MKKLMIMLTAVGMMAATALAQTQMTNRTNSRTHNRADTSRAQNKSRYPATDADRNNPTNTTNPTNNTNNGVNTSTPNQVNPSNPNTNNPNNPNINNNVR